MEIEYARLEEWNFDINDYLADITNDKFDMLAHVNWTFLFCNFNNYWNLIGDETFKAKHTIIADENYALEKI